MYVAYTDAALVVAARLSDAPDSISAQVTGRDVVGNSDWFGVSVNPYRDGIQASNFVVTATGGQVDSRFTASARGTDLTSGDRSWDAVWRSAVQRTEDGWTVEMRIPFSMLRFPKGSSQYWDVNFERGVARTGQRAFWRPVDPRLQGSAGQMGRLRNLHGIDPGPRLQLTPFVAGSLTGTTRPDAPDGRALDVGSGYGVGMDVKYGLTEAFTLDMTLVPDFSGARSDDQILNLGPAEVQFGENRAFFVEGTELFNKGGYFYSRRIGGGLYAAQTVNDLGEGTEVDALPARAQLLNATKVTGRTRGGLGVGVMNAVEGESRVAVTPAEGEGYEAGVHPLTNYSVVALDQNLPNNSYVTLLNTSVLRDGAAADANLTATVFDLRDRGNRFAVWGKGAVSQRFAEGATDRGHSYSVNAGKIGGRLTYSAGYYVESDTYDPNDLGFLRANNERAVSLDGAYHWFEPTGPFNDARVGLGLRHGRLYRPGRLTGTTLSYTARATTRSFLRLGAFGWSSLGDSHDYQDTRTPGRRLTKSPYVDGGAWVSTDGRRDFAVSVTARAGSEWDGSGRQRLGLRVSPRWRLSDQLSVRIGGDVNAVKGSFGYVGHHAGAVDFYGLDVAGTNYQTLPAEAAGYGALADDAILVGDRDVRTVEAETSISYAITPNANLSVRARHYWSAVTYTAFQELGPGGERVRSGYRGTYDDGAPAHDRNFNSLNVDAFFRWRFAPGSDALLGYRTQANYDGVMDGDYLDNARALGTEPVTNTLTLKVVYWLDAGGWLRRKPVDAAPVDDDPLLAPGPGPVTM